MYVTRINADSNEVVLGSQEDLMSTTLWASRVSYVSGTASGETMRVEAKIRYKAEPSPATVVPISADSARVEFDEPQRAVTPGQAVVFYDGDRILGGGYIEIEAPVGAVVA
jgi:tRNA-specific 2-thiouridylase